MEMIKEKMEKTHKEISNKTNWDENVWGKNA